MVFGGISLKGSYHSENQDSYISRKIKDKYLIVVSDGLGSKKYSKRGSKAICESAIEYLNKHSILPNDQIKIFKDIHKLWIKKVDKYGVSNCYCTFLMVIITKNKFYLFRLGDGVLCIKTDKNEYILRDFKIDSFCNQTYSLCENIDYKELESYIVYNERIIGAIAFSDGLTIYPEDNDNYKKFMNDFILEYKKNKKNCIYYSVKNWLKDWPSSDDKTLAYYLK